MGSIKQVLATSQLFEGLTDDELDKIVALCWEQVYEQGTILFSEGDEAKELYVVQGGRVVLEITLHIGSGSGRRGTADVISEGAVFGCPALCEPRDCVNSARCIEKTRVLVFNGEELCNFFKKNPHTGYKVVQRLAKTMVSRFQHAASMLANILSIASHDLKAPLAAVESYHQVVLGGYAGEITEKQKQMLLRSSERITGLLNLIDNILDISHIDVGELKMELMSLLKVVESSRGIIQPLAEEKGVQLKVEVPKELPLITCAPDRLQQVFTNLLGNAVKFTPHGGTVTLKVSEANDHILAEVTDTGIGILPEELPLIFDDFYRGIRVDETGTGLGLSISKKIIEAHRGKVWVESPCPESGIGSRFTFTLPKKLATIRGE